MSVFTTIQRRIARWALKTATFSAVPSWVRESVLMPTFANLVKEGYQKNAAFFACTSALAFAFPEPPLAVYSKADDELLPLHPLRPLMQRPNHLMGEAELWAITIVYMAIGGNAYWHKVRNRAGQVIALWPYHQGQMWAIPGGEGWVSHYEFDVGDGRRITIPLRDIVHFKWPSPDPQQPWQAQPPLRAVAGDVDAANEVSRYVYALLANDAVPRTIISQAPTRYMDDDEVRRAKEQFKDNYSGDQRGGVLVLEAGATVQRLSLNLQEMAADTLFNIPESHIASALRVPAIIAGLSIGLARSTYSNYEEARLAFTEDTLATLWRLTSSEIEADQDLNPGGDRIRRDLSQVVALQKRHAERFTQANTAVVAGWMTLNEALSHIGKSPVPGGDIYLWNMSIIPQAQNALASLGDTPAPAQPTPPPPAALAAPAQEQEKTTARPMEWSPALPWVMREAKGTHTGVMVALSLPESVARALALDPSTLPAGSKALGWPELHLTLAFLGDGKQLALLRPVVEATLAIWARLAPAISGVCSGVGRFNAPEGQPQPVYVSFDAPELAAWRTSLVEALTLAGVPVSLQHGFDPHITLAYVQPDVLTPLVNVPAYPLAFDALTLAWGDEQTAYPLLGIKRQQEAERKASRTRATARIGRNLQKMRVQVAGRMERALDDYFSDLAATVVARAEKSWAGLLETKDLPAVSDLLKIKDAGPLRDLARRYYGELLSASWDTWNDELGVELAFDLNDKLVVDILKAADNRMNDVAETTFEAIRTYLADSAEAGLTLSEMVRGKDGAPGLRDLVEETYKGRAKAIARTEMGTAQNVGAHTRYKAAGVKKVRVFDNGQSDPDDACAKVNNTVQTLEWMLSNPLEHPNCTRAFGVEYED